MSYVRSIINFGSHLHLPDRTNCLVFRPSNVAVRSWNANTSSTHVPYRSLTRVTVVIGTCGVGPVVPCGATKLPNWIAEIHLFIAEG
jgi:hypothetical protein